MAVAYAVVSGKGGVGKSTFAANVSWALARQGRRACLIDMDIGLRSLDVLLGLENRVVFDVVDVLEGTCPLQQALLWPKGGPALLPAAQTRDAAAVTGPEMEALIRLLKRDFDFVIIDAPAGVGRGFQNAVCAADNAIIVTVPDAVSLRDAERVKGLLEREGIHRPFLFLNRLLPEHMEARAPVSVERCVALMQIYLLGVAPEDARVSGLAAGGRLCVMEKTPAGMAFERTARRLNGGHEPIVYPARRGFFHRFFGKR